MGYSDYDFKFAKTILRQHFRHLMKEIEAAIGELPAELRARGISLGCGSRPTLAKVLEDLLVQKNWQRQQPVTPDHAHLRFDLNDLLKFLLAYNWESLKWRLRSSTTTA
ncbi:MAG: hypothetical protein KEFWMYNX_001369 [Candidatus Fervidibacter sp.]|jgi:hypothetical protein